jgi:site-specific recombinase XerD
MPSLIRRSHGVWYFKVTENGEPTWIRKKKKNKRLARGRYSEMADKYDRGLLDLREKKKPIPTLQELFDEYLPYCKTHRQPSTYRASEGHIRLALGPALGHIRATDLKPGHVEKLVGKMLDNEYHPRTINLRLETLRKILRRAVENKDLPEMPCAIKMLPEPTSLPRYATPEHIRDWMGYLDVPHRLRAILSLMTGITDRDLGFVLLDGYDHHNAMLRFRRPKTTTDIVVPLTPVAVQILDALVKDNPGPSLFSAASARKAFYTASKNSQKHGGKNLTPHMLRHSFATWLLSIGVPLAHLQQVLGHKSIKTTERYAKVMPGHLRSSMDKIEAKEFDITGLLSMPHKAEQAPLKRWTDEQREAQAERMRGNKIGLKTGKYAGRGKDIKRRAKKKRQVTDR